MNTNILGLSGVGRAGKDFTFKFIQKYVPAMRVAFADELKNSVKNLAWDLFKIDIWTEDLKEKEIIRPLLVCVGNTARSINENVWVDKVRPILDATSETGDVACITDARFPNEANFIQNELNGILIYVDRVLDNGSFQPPANQSEAENSPIMKQRANIHIVASNLQELEQEVVTKIVPLLKKEKV